MTVPKTKTDQPLPIEQSPTVVEVIDTELLDTHELAEPIEFEIKTGQVYHFKSSPEPTEDNHPAPSEQTTKKAAESTQEPEEKDWTKNPHIFVGRNGGDNKPVVQMTSEVTAD